MAFQFKLNNPGVKFGFFILLPIIIVLLAFSIVEQSCSGEVKVQQQTTYSIEELNKSDAGLND